MRESQEQPNAVIAIVDDDPSVREGRSVMNREKITACRPFLLCLDWPRKTLAAMLGSCLFYLLLGATPVYALDPSKRLTQYMHTSWRIQDGSAPAGMVGVGQTADGFLWLSSLSGDMYRFDGVRFVPWSVAADHHSISTVNVAGDRIGGLWAVGRGDVVHFKRGSIASHFGLEGAQQLQTMSADVDGSLWVVRSANGVSDAALCHVTDLTVKCFGKADGVPIAPIDSILADGAGGFWLGGQTSLVHWHSGISETYPVPALKSNAGQSGIVSLALDHEGTFWVGILAEGPGLGLGRLVGNTVKPFVTPAFDGSKVVVSAMVLDHDSNLWVGSIGKGLYRIHGNHVDQYQHTEGLSSDTVVALFEDREGIIWVATTNGIDSFHDPRITSFSALEGLPKDSASGVLAARDGTIWVANSESLDHIVNGSVSSIRTGSGLPGHQVTSLLEDHSGNLWVGVDDGLYLFEHGQFRRLPEPHQRPLGLVVGITEDIDGNIWAECRGTPRKLVRIRHFQVQEEFPESQIPAGRTLAADPHGGIWISTSKGDIALLRNGVLVTKFPLNPGGDPFNRRIVAEVDGSVLAGSENGLVGWRQGKVQRLTTRNGLPCDSAISFVEDAEKHWWLYTRCGVVEFPDSELQRWWANADAVIQARLYDALDGAQPSVPSFNSAAYSSDGRVWFANGLVVQTVDPSVLSQKALPAETYIESVIADRKELAATENLKLPPHPRDLQIDYTSPTFLIPKKVKFRYRLDPYDHDWHDAGTRRQAFYTDLPPRKYTFRVMASNSDGVWSETAAKLDFSVAPAYYQTTWFRALCGTTLLALVWAAYQLRVRQLQRDFKKLQDVIDTIPAIVFEVGPDGSGAFANPRWLEYTGSPLQQYGRFAPENQAWRDSTCIHLDDLDGYVKLWERAIATGQSFELETRVRRADGEYRWFLARHVPLHDEQGKILKWFGTLTDIEDRRRAEQERERLHQLEADLAHINRVSMMGELAASIAHEVNQPLSGVVSNGSACLRWLAGDSPNLEEAREASRRIVRDGKRAGEVIARIRALTKKASTPREKLALNETIREVLALVGDEAKRKSVNIRTQFADDLSPVSGDEVQLQQVVLNLAMNAIEAMSSVGERARELVIATQNIERDEVQVTVEDSGIGIDPQMLDKIFDSFYTTKPGGMGMGLSISRSILQAHGGRLWATAKGGAGSIFYFTLPKCHEEGSNAGAA